MPVLYIKKKKKRFVAYTTRRWRRYILYTNKSRHVLSGALFDVYNLTAAPVSYAVVQIQYNLTLYTANRIPPCYTSCVRALYINRCLFGRPRRPTRRREKPYRVVIVVVVVVAVVTVVVAVVVIAVVAARGGKYRGILNK